MMSRSVKDKNTMIVNRTKPVSFAKTGAALVLVGTLGMLAIGTPTISARSAHATAPYIIGVSNSIYGNGWRNEMVCSVQVEAKTAANAALVSKVIVDQAGNDPARQISDIRTLISQGANAILIDPPNPTALNKVIEQAVSRGVVVVVLDQLVTSKAPYQVENDQVKYGALGMAWLAKQLHGKGNVVLVRGAAGAPGDTDRQTGINQVLKANPGIKVVGQYFTNWDAVTALQQTSTFLPTHPKIDGWWTSGLGAQVVQAYQTAKRPFVPVVGADDNTFLTYLGKYRSQGLIGAGVTNPPAVGAAALVIALNVLQGKTEPKITKLTPEVWTNATPNGLQGKLLSGKVGNNFQNAYTVPGVTHYTLAQMTACYHGQ
jgi:ribose transport system substrate-binding protein